MTVERSETTLAGLKAERVVARFRESTTKKDMVHDVVNALRSVRRGENVPPHEYLVSLRTTAEHYPADSLPSLLEDAGCTLVGRL